MFLPRGRTPVFHPVRLSLFNEAADLFGQCSMFLPVPPDMQMHNFVGNYLLQGFRYEFHIRVCNPNAALMHEKFVDGDFERNRLACPIIFRPANAKRLFALSGELFMVHDLNGNTEIY